MVDAPLVSTIAGNPLETMVDFPGDESDSFMKLVSIDGIPVGEDSGSEGISGIIARAGKWVGDSVIVRIEAHSWDVCESGNAGANWIGDYNVTLQAVDPFWDTIGGIFCSGYVSHIYVNKTQGQPTVLHFDPAMKLPKTLAKHRPKPHPTKKRVPKAPRFVPASRDANVYALPTLIEAYLTFMNKTMPVHSKKRCKKTDEQDAREKKRSDEAKAAELIRTTEYKKEKKDARLVREALRASRANKK